MMNRILNQNIKTLTENHTRSISSVKWQIKPRQAKYKKEYKKKIKHIEGLRGRKLIYPYIGSGRGSGAYVELKDGSIKMDLIGGIGVQILGHAHPEIIKTAVTAGLSDIVMQGHLLINQEYLDLSKTLVRLAGKQSRLKNVWLSTSGAMANENALKIARQKNSPKRKVLAFEGAFAGRTTMMSEITSNPAVKEGLPSYGEVLRVPFYDPKNPDLSLSVLKSHLEKESKNICAFIFEIVLGEGGYKSAPPSFFKTLMEECKKHSIAVWVDEVQTFCRTGQFFAFEKWGLGPYVDLCTIGKSLQLAGTFFTEEYQPRPGLISGTFSASTGALAVSLKILNILKKHYIGKTGKIQKIEQEIKNTFKELKHQNLICDYDVFGLMAGCTLTKVQTADTVKPFLQQLFQEGVIAFSCGRSPVRVRFLFPAVITKNDLKKLKNILQNILK